MFLKYIHFILLIAFSAAAENAVLFVGPAPSGPGSQCFYNPRFFLENGFRSVEAATLSGEKLKTRMLSVGGKTVGAEWRWDTNALTSNSESRLPVRLVFNKGAPSKQSFFLSSPWAVSEKVVPMTTRPFTPDQFYSYEAFTHESKKKALRLQNNPPSKYVRDRFKPIEGKRIHLRTALLLDKPLHAKFGTTTKECAWFLFVNGKHVCDWKSVEESDGDYFSRAPIGLSEGLHLVDIFIFRKRFERNPELMVLKDDKAVPLENLQLVSPDLVSRYHTENPQAPVTAVSPRLYYLPAQRKLLHGIDMSGSYSIQGYEHFADNLFLAKEDIRGNVYPEPADKTGFIPALQRYISLPEPVEPDIILEHWPIVLQPGETAEIRGRVSFYKNRNFSNKTLRNALTLCVQWDNERVLIPSGSFEEFSVSSKILPTTESIRLSVVAGNATLSRPMEIQLLRPGKRLGNLQGGENGLLSEGIPFIAVCDPPTAEKASEAANVNGIIIPDDVIGCLNAPGSDVSVRDILFLNADETISINSVPLNDFRFRGVYKPLRPFFALCETEIRESAVLLLFGAGSLREGEKAQEFCRKLMFTGQYIEALGGVPVPVTLPFLPDVDAERQRLYALYTKETAFRNGWDVIDLYSFSAGPEKRREFLDFYEYAEIPLTVPSNKGRIVICNRISEMLHRLFPAIPFRRYLSVDTSETAPPEHMLRE